MKVASGLLLVGAAVAEQPAFNEWKDQYGIQYNGDEDAKREEIYNSNVRVIEESNLLEPGYTLAVNQFAAVTREEFKAQMLTRGQTNAFPALPTLGVHEWNGEELAASVDWSSKGAVTGVKDQGSCGGCWAFAATGGLEGAQYVGTGSLNSLSEQQFLDCDTADSGCNGGLEYNGWTYFKQQKDAICTEASYPYDGRGGSCRSSGCSAGVPAGGIGGVTHVTTGSASALMSAVSQQPVAIGIQADQASFQYYDSGIMSGNCGKQLDHSVLLVGYDSGSYWKIKNSWGKSWGESGYIRITQTGDQCGVLDDASYPTVTAAAADVVV